MTAPRRFLVLLPVLLLHGAVSAAEHPRSGAERTLARIETWLAQVPGHEGSGSEADPADPADPEVRSQRSLRRKALALCDGRDLVAAGDLARRRLLARARLYALPSLAGWEGGQEESEADAADLERALSLLADWTAPSAEPWDEDRGAPFVLAGRLLRIAGRHREALVLLDWIARNSRDAHGLHAAIELGRCHLENQRFGEAGEAFGYVKKRLREQFANYLDEEPYRGLRRSAAHWLDELRSARQAHLWGPDFLLYRSADRARRIDGDPDRARELFRRVVDEYPDGLYADAALLGAARCLLDPSRPDRLKRGVEELMALWNREPRHGPYRGEAALLLGRVALEYRLERRTASLWFTRADHWIREVRHSRKDPAGFHRRFEASRAPNRPPEHEFEVDPFWDRVDETSARPGALVNRFTCDWYLNDLEEEAARFRGLLALIREDSFGARRHWDRLPLLDARNRRGDLETDPNDYTRLMFGAEHGFLIAEPPELALYRDRALRLAVLLADFYYVTRQWSRGEAICQRILAGEFGRCDRRQRDYPLFLIGNCRYWRDGRAAARKAFLEVLKTRDRTYTEVKAAYVVGKLALEMNDRAIREDGIARLHELVRQDPDGEWGAKARIALGVDLIHRDRHEEGYAWLESVPASVEDWHGVARWYLELAEEARAMEELPPTPVEGECPAPQEPQPEEQP